MDLLSRFKHVLHCMESSWQEAAWPCEGKLWVRWGVDGVPRWSCNYVTLTLALCGEHADFKMHSVERFAHCAVLSGTETLESVTALFETTNFDGCLRTLKGKSVRVQGKSFGVRSLLLGDHMLQYKATGANGPYSTRADKQPCPYCDVPPDQAFNWRAQPRPLQQAPRPLAPLNGITRDQCIPDAMHGCHSVLYNVLLASAREKLLTKGCS